MAAMPVGNGRRAPTLPFSSFERAQALRIGWGPMRRRPFCIADLANEISPRDRARGRRLDEFPASCRARPGAERAIIARLVHDGTRGRCSSTRLTFMPEPARR